MKIKTIFLIIVTFVLLFWLASCNQNNDKSNSKVIQTTESQKLENLKKQKQKEADSLKKEIETLKQKRDSVNEALKNAE